MDEATDKRLANLEEVVREYNQNLHALELRMEEVKHMIQTGLNRHEDINRRTETLERFMFGDGKGNPGLRTQVDRLERTEETRSWSLRALWVGMIGVITRVIYDLIGKN